MDCCSSIQAHPNASTSVVPCTVCDKQWKLKVEWAMDATGEPMRLQHRIAQPGRAHDPACEGCLLKSILGVDPITAKASALMKLKLVGV